MADNISCRRHAEYESVDMLARRRLSTAAVNTQARMLNAAIAQRINHHAETPLCRISAYMAVTESYPQAARCITDHPQQLTCRARLPGNRGKALRTHSLPS